LILEHIWNWICQPRFLHQEIFFPLLAFAWQGHAVRPAVSTVPRSSATLDITAQLIAKQVGWQ
jgi:hypothetical protein